MNSGTSATVSEFGSSSVYVLQVDVSIGFTPTVGSCSISKSATADRRVEKNTRSHPYTVTGLNRRRRTLPPCAIFQASTSRRLIASTNQSSKSGVSSASTVASVTFTAPTAARAARSTFMPRFVEAVGSGAMSTARRLSATSR
jgi:hypothetical protein